METVPLSLFYVYTVFSLRTLSVLSRIQSIRSSCLLLVGWGGVLEEFIGLGEIDDCLLYISSSTLCRTLSHNSNLPWGHISLCRKEFDPCGEVSADEKCSMFQAIILSCISSSTVRTFVIMLLGVLFHIWTYGPVNPFLN